jgi:heptosyltransferase-2
MKTTPYPPKNIIVRMPNWLGDLVMATPVLKDLRDQFPDAKITAMCQSKIASLLKDDPNIDELYSFNRPSGWIRGAHESAELISTLRHGNYDLGILLTNSFSSAWWFWRGNVKNRLGYADHCRSLLMTEPVPFPANLKKQHLVVTYKMLLERLGITVSDTAPQLYLSPAEQAAAKELLTRDGVNPLDHTIIGINPGAAYGSAKCWLPERFVEVSKILLQDPKVRILYFGDYAGAPLVRSICEQLPGGVINFAGKTSLRELAALMMQCKAFLTNDSGPMHVASALDIPLVALFGSTSDVRTGPYKNGVVIHKHVECSPCYQRECPIDFRCMTRIEANEVVAAVQKQLSIGGRKEK